MMAMWTVWETLAFAVLLLVVFMACHAPFVLPDMFGLDQQQWDWGGFTGALIGVAITLYIFRKSTAADRFAKLQAKAQHISKVIAALNVIIRALGNDATRPIFEYRAIADQAYAGTYIEEILRMHPDKRAKMLGINLRLHADGNELQTIMQAIGNNAIDYPDDIIELNNRLIDVVARIQTSAFRFVTSLSMPYDADKGIRYPRVDGWQPDVERKIEEFRDERGELVNIIIELTLNTAKHRDALQKSLSNIKARLWKDLI